MICITLSCEKGEEGRRRQAFLNDASDFSRLNWEIRVTAEMEKRRRKRRFFQFPVGDFFSLHAASLVLIHLVEVNL